MMQVQGGGILPSEYQQVEYIECSSPSRAYGQYIELPYIVNENSLISTRCMQIFNSSYDSGLIYGTSTYTAEYGSGIGFYTSIGRFERESRSNYYYFGNAETNKIYDIKRLHHSIWINDGSGDVEYSWTYSIYSQENIRLFAWAYNSVKRYNQGMRMYYFAISESDIELFHLIPCYRKSDNVVGMYDIVNGVFYTNQGTGQFIAGQPV